MKITYIVEGKDRKELANAIGKLLGMEPIYRKAPTFAYVCKTCCVRFRSASDTRRSSLRILEARTSMSPLGIMHTMVRTPSNRFILPRRMRNICSNP